MFTDLSPMNPADADVPFTADFSGVLGAGETIASVTSVTASPDSITASTGIVIDGARPACAVQFTLSNGANGYAYTVAVTIHSTAGVTLTRTMLVSVTATV